MGDSKIFKCGFDMEDYIDILPSRKEYLTQDKTINYDEWKKGNIENCLWKRHVPSLSEITSTEFRAREVRRILKTGAWICISEELVWLPPQLYFAYQYGKVGEDDLQFRLKRVKHAYFKIRTRNNPNSKGSLTLKNRADGETTMSISDAMWEMMDGNMNVGQIGIQSKTRSDVQNPCWSTAQVLWQSYPVWLKDALYSDFISGDNIAEKMQFMRSGDEGIGLKARNVRMQYYPCVFNAMDGKHNMKKCILDEVCKWVEAEFYDTYTNYSKFIMPGLERRGLFDMFSSPSDVPCKSNEQVYNLWKDSNPDEITDNGTTKSRVHRYYSNPLDGIQGAYDKFGDADPQMIYNWIMKERKNVSKDKLMGEIRGFPLNEQEMFESEDGQNLWDNQKGINARKIYLIGTRFKNVETQEPIGVYGNLSWIDGIQDSDVEFRMSDKTEFDLEEARFCFSYLPQNKDQLRYGKIVVRGTDIGDRPLPPKYVENVCGIDPFDKRYPGKDPSNGAIVNQKFRDIYETGIVKCPTMIYCNRPQHNEIFYEDCIKAAVFNRAKAQPESINSKVIDWFEDRGYEKWMLAKRGQPHNSLIKGDAPTGGKSNTLLDEIVGLINAITNTPLLKTDQYLLELNWFYELLDDVSKFNKADTHKNDLSMAWGQALLGCVKILRERKKPPSGINVGVLDYLLN